MDDKRSNFTNISIFLFQDSSKFSLKREKMRRGGGDFSFTYFPIQIYKNYVFIYEFIYLKTSSRIQLWHLNNKKLKAYHFYFFFFMCVKTTKINSFIYIKITYRRYLSLYHYSLMSLSLNLIIFFTSNKRKKWMEHLAISLKIQ